MKKNGYLRRFLAMFLALVMIMADSSVTTFAATVGMVKQQNATAESSSQCSVQINVAEELDLEQFLNDYKYIMLGTSAPKDWPYIKATSSIEEISTTETIVLNNVAEGTERKIYFLQGKENWQWGDYKTDGDTFQQGENKFKISVSETAGNLTVNINKVEIISHTVQITADADFDFAAFTNEYKYVALGQATSLGVKAVSTIEEINSATNSATVKVDGDINIGTDISVYFVKENNEWALNSGLTDGSKYKKDKNRFRISVTAAQNNNWNVSITKEIFSAGPTVDYASVLGNALHYGIVANDFEAGGHMEANLAVGTLRGSSNMNSSKNSGGNGVTLIGEYVDNGWFIEPNVKSTGDLIIYTTEEALERFHFNMRQNPKGVVIDTTTYTKEEIQAIVRNMVNDTIRTSEGLNLSAEQYGISYSEAQENGVLDLTGSPAGTYYINFKNGEYANSNLQFEINGNQNIVLNIPDTTVTAKAYTLKIDGVDYDTKDAVSDIDGGRPYEPSEKVIYNFPNAADVKLGNLEGTILAPKAYVYNDGVGAGCIVGNKVKISGSEWHCVSKDIPEVISYALKAKKLVNGNAPSANENGKFTFELYQINDDGSETRVDEKTNGDGGLVLFDTFGNITKLGTYWYKIVEKKVEGYTTDATIYYAEVKVEVDSNNGVITSKNAKVTYHRDSKTGDTVTIATFNNIKKQNETSANIKVKKTFTNGAADKKFNFVLTSIDNAPMPEGSADGKKTISVSQNDGVQNFGEIKYTTAGTYKYEVVEDSSEQVAGITYDNHKWTVTVTVPEDFSTPTVTYSRNDGATSTIDAEFTNSEEKTSVSVRKVWTDSDNQDGIRPDAITVQLYAGETAQGAAVELNEANNWSYTWTGLADKADGEKIIYKVDEVTVPEGYTKTVTANENKTEYVITNTHETEKTEATVKKVWDDSNDQDGIRPKELTVTLMNGNTVVGTVTLNEANGWSGTIDNLEKKAGGKDIEYTWTEGRMPEGYSLTNTAKGEGNVTTLTNSYTPGKTSISVRKVWTDSDNQDGIRPDAITVQLYAGETAQGAAVELNEANNWSYTWTGLADKADGEKIIYKVDEVTVPEGYTKTVTANENKTEYVITNTHETEKTEATVKKVWDDSNDQDGIRPKELTVTLMNGNTVVGTVTLNEANGWSGTIDNLEKKAGGKDIEYTWTEGRMPEGYSLTNTAKGEGNVTTLTNTYVPETVSITGTKTWDDANNQDGKRPTSIKINLLANGNVVKSLDVTAATNWNYSFTDLPKYETGTEIKYTVEEEAVADYETKVEDYNITNTHKPETTSISGTKTWNDSDNQDGKRPESITVNLLADGKITATKTVTAKDNWTYSFTDLPKYANGQEITYTVNEIPVPEYTTTYNNYDITNSYTPGQTSASVTKIWADADNQDGIRPESITVALLADGKATDTTVTLNAANNWTQTVTGLPEKADGEYITYTWTEVDVPEGYSLTGTSKTGIVTTLTNTHTPELTSITGTKTWEDADNQDGKRPESITVNLFADGTLLKSQTVSADTDGNWSYSFTDLPKYANGQEIIYTVTEDAVEGYTTELDGNNIINTHQPETTEITGTKTWNDANNQDGKRPESITVILLANGAEKDRQTVTADEAGNWTYTFKDLPKYANGQEITYTVAEEEVTDYTTTYDGNNITNRYTPGKTSATVTKIWNDADNQDGKRPESITVSLLADGEAIGETVTLSAENNWTQTVSDLPEKANGKAIEYTWTEEALPEGYELTDNSKNGTVTTLTNTYAPETVSITGTKTWDDADNQDGKRPESIIINLLANGEIAASQTVTADGAGNWTYTFTDLPKYANGEEITYTVIEEAVEGYETSVDGFNITNAYTTETTEVKGTKTWNDSDNQDGKRPESITVRLLANGEEKDSKTVTADENGNWTYSFENLPKYEAGKEIAYTVTEDAVADYTTEITGYDITNSYAPGKTSVTVTKAWADNNDRDGHRPKEIKVQLKADGENSGEEITLNAENKWTYTWSDLDQKKAGKDIVYTVEETSETTGYISEVTGDAAEGFVITNTITSVKISKVDITDQKELAGAHIQVIDKDGNVVDEWDSTWESHEVTGLKTGETYTLRETVAPDGYAVTADTTFVLKEDGTLDKDNTSTTIADDGRLLVEDSRTFVKVSKVDISDGEELEGAHIQIIDGDGNIVDEWDSTKEAHVTEKLKIGKTYTLRETVAPDGYLLTNDTTFVLKEDGTVDTEKTTTVSKDGVLLVQDSLATSASIAVTKRLTYVGENLVAKDQTFYVALYSDKECTKRVSDVKALEFKNADASTVVFSENIKAGKTYYIAECTEDGISQVIGALADGTTYEAVFGDGNSTTVTEADGTTTVSFENVFSSFPPDGFYRQGQLTITKRVLGADGDTKNSDKVFYAGIFDDAAHTQLSQQVEQNIIELKMDGGYEVSEIINVGLAQPGTKVTLYVTETDSNGKPIAGSEDFGYKVSVSADSVTIDDTNMTAEVVITNQEEATETPTPTPSSDDGNGGGSEDHSSSYGGKSPKTGDDTPIGTYLMLLLAAAMLAAETERRRRRNKR